jgi:RND family efflux transporter MFP subunit
MHKLPLLLLAGALLFSTATRVNAGEEQTKAPDGPPPMLVATAEMIEGSAEPMAEFVGTVYFARTSKVAAEVEGVVRSVLVKDGESVSKGARLVVLDDELLATELEGTRATYEQNEVDVEQARRDFQRIANLYEQDSIAETEYEAYQTTQRRFEKLSIVLKARLDKLLLEQKKKTIHAPFTGVVIETLVEAGEWAPAGGTVALVADNRTFEVLVDIQADLLGYLEPGRKVTLTVGKSTLEGSFLTVIPKGDIATRAFSAKFGVKAPNLIEGMEARVQLPTAAASAGLLVPRDAVTNSFGQDVIFTIEQGQARMHTVQIIGHTQQMVAVSSPDLHAGQQVVIKGNERIRDGQAVTTGD